MDITIYFLILALPIAFFSVVKHRNTLERVNRKLFIIIFLIVSLPAFILTASDISLMLNGKRLPYASTFFQVMNIWFFIAAYPFYQRVCARVNDAGVWRWVSFVCLVPYVNLLIFLYLCIAPSKPRT
ncbi:MAG: DUF805 domain-containing protein [Rhodospirillaceae bacterium]